MLWTRAIAMQRDPSRRPDGLRTDEEHSMALNDKLNETWKRQRCANSLRWFERRRQGPFGPK
jgi:hypothetical protein